MMLDLKFCGKSDEVACCLKLNNWFLTVKKMKVCMCVLKYMYITISHHRPDSKDVYKDCETYNIN